MTGPQSQGLIAQGPLPAGMLRIQQVLCVLAIPNLTSALIERMQVWITVSHFPQ